MAWRRVQFAWRFIRKCIKRADAASPYNVTIQCHHAAIMVTKVKVLVYMIYRMISFCLAARIYIPSPLSDVYQDQTRPPLVEYFQQVLQSLHRCSSPCMHEFRLISTLNLNLNSTH